MAELLEYHFKIKTQGVSGNKIEIFDISSKKSFTFSFGYSSGREGLYFYDGNNNIVILATPFAIDTYFGIICEDGKIWVVELTDVPHNIYIKRLL